MVFLSKICTVFLLPPGCFVLGLFMCALFFSRRRRLLTMFAVLAAALLYTLSIQPVQDLLLKPLEDFYPPLEARMLTQSQTPPTSAIPTQTPAQTQTPVQTQAVAQTPTMADVQALVILGGGTVQASPEAGEGQDTLSPGALKRTVYAFGLRDIFPGVYIAAGGRVFDYGQEAEADVTGRLLISLGLPAQRILKESASRNTWQNAKNTAQLFGYKKIILVTSAFHMRRSVFCFENNGFSVIPAPTDYRCARNSRYDIFSFLPSLDAFSATCTALHEYIGLLYYRLVYP